MVEKIKKTLEEVRPLLAQHLGDIEFVKFENGVVYVRMLGTCVGCPLSQITLKSGVEEILKSKVSEVERVEAI
ncbi:MAG: NifU family protein [Candidatus Sungbacteria bacterium]|nr:NifU family protein [Candidatus Sungbacteria bacterium]